MGSSKQSLTGRSSSKEKTRNIKWTNKVITTVMKYAKKAKKKQSSSDKPISCDMMNENLLADLSEGLIYVLAKEARTEILIYTRKRKVKI